MNEVAFSHGDENSSLPPGVMKAGMWLQTGAESDAADPDSGLPNTGFYLLADQMLLPEAPASDQGLGVFAGTGFTPPGRNVVDYYLNTGLVYKGMIPGRDEDTCGAGFSLANQHGEGAEMVLEATYQCVVTPWCFVQPDIQYVIQSAAASPANAFVLGLRVGVIF